MKSSLISRWVMLLFFFAAAVLQYNDSDGWAWVVIYGYAALMTIALMVGWRPPVGFFTVGIYATLLYLPLTFALDPGGWLSQPPSEVFSEFGGVLIVSLWLYRLKRSSRRGRVEPFT